VAQESRKKPLDFGDNPDHLTTGEERLKLYGRRSASYAAELC